jgi:hypothetical protein
LKSSCIKVVKHGLEYEENEKSFEDNRQIFQNNETIILLKFHSYFRFDKFSMQMTDDNITSVITSKNPFGSSF